MNWDSIKRLFGVSTKSEGTPRSNDGIFNSLSKSRELLGKKLANLFAKFAVGHVADEISHQALLTELEELLYSADLGSEIVEILLQELSRMAKPWQRETIMARWYQILVELLPPLTNVTPSLTPKTILMIGVNGVGKTTSTAKLANFYKNVRHQRVLLAAADTYRAGAIEQLKIWAQRLDIDCIHQQEGADPAAVVFDAITAAKSRTIDVLIVDTGGRLHTKQNLMESLEKIQRTALKLLPSASANEAHPQLQKLLVIDATTGQNGLAQAKEFNKSVGISGIIVTKLDGTAKGGSLIAICRQLQLPILFVGTGETINDLQPFNRESFVAGLLMS